MVYTTKDDCKKMLEDLRKRIDDNLIHIVAGCSAAPTPDELSPAFTLLRTRSDLNGLLGILDSLPTPPPPPPPAPAKTPPKLVGGRFGWPRPPKVEKQTVK